MTAHLLAHFKEWIEVTLLPFYITREVTSIVPRNTTNDVGTYHVVDWDASSCGETKARYVNGVKFAFYCCINGKGKAESSYECECGKQDAYLQEYTGATRMEECDANGVESESSFLERTKDKQNSAEKLRPGFRIETAGEAYARFFQSSIDAHCIAEWCERRQLATELKAFTAEICLANSDAYEHLSVLMQLPTLSSYSHAEMLQFRKSARSLKQMIALHYAYEGAGGQHAEANFNEVAAQNAYFKAKLENARENTQVASELLQVAAAIAKSMSSIDLQLQGLAKNSKTVTEKIGGVVANLDELSNSVRDIPVLDVSGIESAIENRERGVGDISSYIGSFEVDFNHFSKQFTDFARSSDKFDDQPRKKSRI